MTKRKEVIYKEYLRKNFEILEECSNRRLHFDDDIDIDIELKAFNNIFGSLFGLIDGKGIWNQLVRYKKLILDYYNSICPENQLNEIDNSLYYKNCYQYIKTNINDSKIDKDSLEILEDFSKAYLTGFNMGKDVTVQTILPYFINKTEKYIFKLEIIVPEVQKNL